MLYPGSPKHVSTAGDLFGRVHLLSGCALFMTTSGAQAGGQGLGGCALKRGVGQVSFVFSMAHGGSLQRPFAHLLSTCFWEPPGL